MVHRSQQTRPGRSLRTGWGESARATDVPSTAEWSGLPADGTGAQARGGSLAEPAAGAPSAPRRTPGALAEIALLLVLVLALPPLLMGGVPAEATARRVLQALVDADVGVLQEHLAPAGDALDIALAPEVIAATGARVEHFTLTAARVDQDLAEVDARLRVGGRTVTTTLHLTRHRDGTWPRRSWALEPLTLPLVQVAIPVGTAQLRVNGQEVTVPEAHRPRGAEGLGIVTLRVLPGLYEIEAEGRDALTAPIPVRVNVPPLLSPWSSAPLEAGYALTDAGTQLFTEQIRDSLQGCLGSTSARPEGCPLAAPVAEGTQGSWRLVTDPEVLVSAGWRGAYTAYVLGGVAEFAVPAGSATGGEQRHRIPVDARAIGVLDRDGAFVTSWNE